MTKPENLDRLVRQIRACTLCSPYLEPRPVLHVSKTAKLCIASQAPGLKVHQTGISFNDASGDRLRAWLGVTREQFYDESKIALAAMAFCFPGYDENGHDLPPRRECAATWRARLFAALPQFETILLVGSYAQAWHLGDARKSNMTETVRAWREYAPRYIPMPHPSWRNTAWLKKNPWFADELLPYLRRRVRRLLAD
ncbi:MAG: uracil-DNA glycosylase family protein [Proteobacteria bacterium]|nr:uracil-DNA glycosylase family protein [Pseudomonadota bacterium]